MVSGHGIDGTSLKISDVRCALCEGGNAVYYDLAKHRYVCHICRATKYDDIEMIVWRNDDIEGLAQFFEEFEELMNVRPIGHEWKISVMLALIRHLESKYGTSLYLSNQLVKCYWGGAKHYINRRLGDD